jgi:hypothetical protein
VAEFAELNQRLTDACKERIGEAVLYRPRNGAEKPLRGIVKRGVERLGDHGQVVGRVTTVSLAKRDITDTIGAQVTVVATGERRAVDGIGEDDGEMIELVLQ